MFNKWHKTIKQAQKGTISSACSIMSCERGVDMRMPSGGHLLVN